MLLQINGPTTGSTERITAWGVNIKEIGGYFVQCRARQGVAVFPRGCVY